MPTAIKVYLIQLADYAHWVVKFGPNTPGGIDGKFYIGPDITDVSNNRWGGEKLELIEAQKFCREMGWEIQSETPHSETIAVKN